MRLLLMLLAMLMAISPAAAEHVVFADDLTGAYIYPEGADEADALYIYRYCYPQLAGDSVPVMLINDTYAYAAEDALGFEAPMLASAMQEGDPQKLVEISYEVTCLNAEYLSVAIYKRVTVAEDVTLIVSGHVFSLTGEKAGTVTSLPYILGLLEPGETDEWYLDRQTQKADECVRELVWEWLEGQFGSVIYDDLTFEEFAEGFYPEEDFYLNPDGDPVFYMMAGSVAPEEEGLLLISIPMEELLDEI